MTTTRTDLARIECACRICKANAAKIGASFPLKADVPATAGAVPALRHGLVHLAHDPSAVAVAARRQHGYVGIR